MFNFLFSNNSMQTFSYLRVKISRFVFGLLALLLMISVMSMTPKQEIHQTNSVSEAEYLDNIASWAETAKLTIDDGILIGRSLAVDNNVLVIGAIDAAYVVIRQGESWTENTQTAKLTASNGESNNFGGSVSISGDTIVVGASTDRINGIKTGAVYIFEKPESGWTDMTETARLRASDSYSLDFFGASVSINGDTVVVGAEYANDNGGKSGSAYVFIRPAEGWRNMTETAKLSPHRLSDLANFGGSVAVSGDTIVIGAYEDRFRGICSGTAYIFEKPTQGWINMTETAELIPSDIEAYDQYGFSVDISGKTVIVGSRADNRGRGSAYIFERSSDEWTTTTEIAKISGSDSAVNDYFGSSVAIRGKTLLVGARDDNTTYEDTGSIYIFIRQAENWISMIETTKLVASDRTENDIFGETVTISGSTVIVGAPGARGYRGTIYFFEIEQ